VRVIDDGHLTIPAVEVERIMGGPGAVIGVGLDAVPELGLRAWSPFDDAVADALGAARGHVDGEKAFWPSIPVLAALGRLDSIQLACNHFGPAWTLLDVGAAGGLEPPIAIASPRALADWIFECYGALLGCGFRLAASGGSGAGVMPNPIGWSRAYARLDGPIDPDAWLRALRAGRSFSTNGPLVGIDVAGAGPGDTIGVARHPRHPVRVWASSPRRLSEVCVVVDGHVVGEWQPPAGEATEFEAELEVDIAGAGWIAARAFERAPRPDAIRFAHTSPVWADGPIEPRRRQRAVAFVEAWLDRTESLLHADERRTGLTCADGRRALARARGVLAMTAGTVDGRFAMPPGSGRSRPVTGRRPASR
jgi:hypothetical protein